MTSKHLTALAIKILAIWLLVNVVLCLPSVVMLSIPLSRLEGNSIPPNWSVFIMLGFIAAGMLVSFTMLKVSNSVLNSVSEFAEPLSLSSVFVLQVVGLFFIVSALSLLPGQFLSIAKQPSIQLATYGYLAGQFFKIGIGAYLFVSPTVWLGWFNRLRGRT